MRRLGNLAAERSGPRRRHGCRTTIGEIHMARRSVFIGRGMVIVSLALATVGCPGTNPTGSTRRLFVVNNSSGNMTDYFFAGAFTGNVAPNHELVGSAVGLTVPRAIAATPAGILFISQHDGGIAAWDDANTVDD